MIEIKSASEYHYDGIIDDIIWVRKELDLAGAMTKPINLSMLFEYFREQKPHYEIEESITREIKDAGKEKTSECENGES